MLHNLMYLFNTHVFNVNSIIVTRKYFINYKGLQYALAV
jgi:hypothetical protein